MFEADLDELDLGSNRNPVKWVSTAPPFLQREKRNPNKRCVLVASSVTLCVALVSWDRTNNALPDKFVI